MKRLLPIIVLSPLIMGASLAPARADAETVKIAGILESKGALDASSLEGVRTGIAPAPGSNDEEELRRKRPDSADADPLKATRGADPRPSESDLSSPFTANLTLDGSPINQQPTQNPPPATNNPPVASNPPPTNNNPPPADNPPPAQNTIPIANNSTLGSVITDTSLIGAGVIRVLRRDGLLR